MRHAASTGQAADAPLTAAGFAQAEALTKLLCALDVARIVSSP
ncbi:MAG TPA: histidine phosphatase family protein [Polyangiales bacterium]|nr:histidine phosphatase family protein [Polyangiales bacterium]